MNDHFYVVTTIGVDGYSRQLFNKVTGDSILMDMISSNYSQAPKEIFSTFIPHTVVQVGKVATDRASLTELSLNRDWTDIMKTNVPGLRFRSRSVVSK